MNYSSWQNSNAQPSTNVGNNNIKEVSSSAMSPTTSNTNTSASGYTGTSTPGSAANKMPSLPVQHNNNAFPVMGRSASQFNEDVSSAVIAAVQVKTQPQHEQVHKQAQQKISKISLPNLPPQQQQHESTQAQQIQQHDQLVQQMGAHRALLLNHQQPSMGHLPSVNPPSLPHSTQQQQLPSLPIAAAAAQQQPQPQSSQQQQHTSSSSLTTQQPIQQTQYQDQLDVGSGNKRATPIDKNGRPLTNTKRAAQNRNAQKAFRLRRVQYVRELEAEVRDIKQLKASMETLREENLQLRDYILTLQGKLLEHENKNSSLSVNTPGKDDIGESSTDGNAVNRFDNDFLRNLSKGKNNSKLHK